MPVTHYDVIENSIYSKDADKFLLVHHVGFQFQVKKAKK